MYRRPCVGEHGQWVGGTSTYLRVGSGWWAPRMLGMGRPEPTTGMHPTCSTRHDSSISSSRRAAASRRYLAHGTQPGRWAVRPRVPHLQRLPQAELLEAAHREGTVTHEALVGQAVAGGRQVPSLHVTTGLSCPSWLPAYAQPPCLHVLLTSPPSGMGRLPWPPAQCGRRGGGLHA